MHIKVSYRYLIYGILFGGLFPILATIIVSYQEFGNLSFQNILAIQSTNLLIWIINTAPLFLGLFAFKAGHTQQNINEINACLEKKVTMFEEEKLSEEEVLELRLIKSSYEKSMDLICIADKDGYFRKVNPRFTEVLGFSEKELLSKPFLTFIHPDDKKPTIKEAAKLATGIPTIEFTNRYKTKSGDFVVLSWNTGVDIESGNLFAIGRDITERIRVKENLEKAMEEAKQGILSKDQFLSNMSHEIRTPMNGIIGMTNILLGTDLTKNQHKFLSAIEYSAKNLHVIINDILDLSKINAEKLSLEKLNFNIRKILDSVHKTLEIIVDDKAIGLHFNIDDRIPEKMSGDPVRVNQILLNIVGNAVKFTEKGSVTVNCSFKSQTEEGFQLDFNIIDTGIGIKKENIESVFKSFTQANNEITRKFGGTGLGLPISKNLIELHGGELHLESEFGKGSTFAFTLNFEKPTLETESITVNKQIEVSLEEKAKISILLVEDNKINQLVAKRFLDQFGFQSDIANNGREAIQKVVENHYDLILMDIQMPELDGLEATRFIRSKMNDQKKGIKIMAMTASVLKKEIDRCFEAGMNDYIPKPFNPDELYEKIVTLTCGLKSGAN